MTKNKKFIKKYVVVVDGVTTNDSASNFLEELLKTMVFAMDSQFKEVSVSIRDYNEEPVDKSKN